MTDEEYFKKVREHDQAYARGMLKKMQPSGDGFNTILAAHTQGICAVLGMMSHAERVVVLERFTKATLEICNKQHGQLGAFEVLFKKNKK